MSLFPNIHRLATRLIPRTPIRYRKGIGVTISEAGLSKPNYGEWINTTASVQPGIISSFGGKNVGEKVYEDMGLDFSRRYYTVWADGCNLHTVANQEVPDQVELYGKIFNVIHCSDWEEWDGWQRVYCVEVINDEPEEQD